MVPREVAHSTDALGRVSVAPSTSSDGRTSNASSATDRETGTLAHVDQSSDAVTSTATHSNPDSLDTTNNVSITDTTAIQPTTTEDAQAVHDRRYRATMEQCLALSNDDDAVNLLAPLIQRADPGATIREVRAFALDHIRTAREIQADDIERERSAS